MEFQFIKPTGFLGRYIRFFCFMESGASEGNVTERVIPIGNVQMMFHYRDPFVVLNADNTCIKQPRSLVSGLCDSFSDVSTNGATGVVFVSFTPPGACNFFDFALSEVENQSINLLDVYHSEIRKTEEELISAGSIKERVGVIENYLIRRFSPIPEYDELLLQKGINYIVEKRGQLNAHAVADALSVSPRTLERKFSQYIGKTTKQLIRLQRFHQVLTSFGKGTNSSMTGFAYDNGYFDQAHFIHDFKKMSGYTPKQFFSKYPDCRVQ